MTYQNLPTLLTKQEELILFMATRDGLTAKEIADKLGISERTVTTHKTNMMAKYGATNLAQLIFKCFIDNNKNT